MLNLRPFEKSSREKAKAFVTMHSALIPTLLLAPACAALGVGQLGERSAVGGLHTSSSCTPTRIPRPIVMGAALDDETLIKVQPCGAQWPEGGPLGSGGFVGARDTSSTPIHTLTLALFTRHRRHDWTLRVNVGSGGSTRRECRARDAPRVLRVVRRCLTSPPP